MLKHLAFRLIGSLLAAGLLSSCATAPVAEPVALRLIGINDFHGNLEASSLSLMLADPQAAAAPPLRVPVGGAPALR